MIPGHLRLPALGLLFLSSIAWPQLLNAQSSQTPPSTHPKAAFDGDLTQLFSRIWQVAKSPSQSAFGSIYIFLANGTLLETSCVETYRIAIWTIDNKAPRALRVVEGGQMAFTATIAELTDTTLQLQQRLAHGNQERDITLKAAEQEFVCPDLRR